MSLLSMRSTGRYFFKKTKEKFKQEHPEVAWYEKAAYLAKHPDDKDSTQKELQEEQEKLVGEIAGLKEPLTEVQADLKKLRDIRYCVSNFWGAVQSVYKRKVI